MKELIVVTDLIWWLPLRKLFENDSNMEVTSLPYFRFPHSRYRLAVEWQAVEIKVIFNKMSFEQSVTVGFMNQSMRPIEPCDCSTQSIFVKKSRDRLGKSVFRITNIRSRQSVEVEGLILCLLRHRNIKLVFWYLL